MQYSENLRFLINLSYTDYSRKYNFYKYIWLNLVFIYDIYKKLKIYNYKNIIKEEEEEK